MNVVCLIATWRDEHLLAEAVASAKPYVDEVIVLDGAYAGVADHAWRTPEGDFVEAANAGALICRAPDAPWPGEIEKRNVLLALGRAFLPDGYLWALVLDADELLVNGEQLRGHIASFSDYEAPGLVRFEPDGTPYQAPSRLFRLRDITRYRLKSYYLATPDGTINLGHWQLDPHQTPPYGPHVRHRWDERSSARQQVQREWGRELARRDHGS